MGEPIVRRQGWVGLALFVVTCLAVLGGVRACDRQARDGGSDVSGPEGWQTVRLGDDVGFAVPPDAQAQDVQPVDSVFGMLRGQGYEVVYNYGRIGEDLSVLGEKPGYARRSRAVDSRPGDDVTFDGDGNPWSVVRLLHVQNGRDHLAIRVACADHQTCRLAEDVFDSIRFTS